MITKKQITALLEIIPDDYNIRLSLRQDENRAIDINNHTIEIDSVAKIVYLLEDEF